MPTFNKNTVIVAAIVTVAVLMVIHRADVGKKLIYGKTGTPQPPKA